jgi:excisionase family DNA binding protein
MRISFNLFTPEQVSEILQINILTVYSYIKKGKLEAIRLGRSYRIAEKDLEHFLELNRVSSGFSKNKFNNLLNGERQKVKS